jgi:hypothetical protein
VTDGRDLRETVSVTPGYAIRLWRDRQPACHGGAREAVEWIVGAGQQCRLRGENSVDDEHRSFWTNPWVIGIGAPLITASILAVVHGLGSPTPGSQANNHSGHSSKTSSSSTTTGTATTPGVAFAGPVGISFSGIDFDSNPPGPGSNDINWQRYNYRLQGYGSVIVSRYPSSGALPTEAACRSWAQTHNSQILDGVNHGDRLCFITQDGRTVRFIVMDITDSAVEGQATVWNDGNQ